MHTVSDTYRRILRGRHRKEGQVEVYDGDTVATILTEPSLIGLQTVLNAFSRNEVSVGSCVSGEIDVVFFGDDTSVPRQAKLIPYVRVRNDEEASEWLKKGVFYVDTRTKIKDKSRLKKITLHGYDSMLKADTDYTSSALKWPAKDIDVVAEIASQMDVEVDSRTYEYMITSYLIPDYRGYTKREIQGYIAAIYASCCIMSEEGKLLLLPIWALPRDLWLLANENDDVIEIGGDCILV